jgi:hypothetical protein
MELEDEKKKSNEMENDKSFSKNKLLQKMKHE